MRVRRPGIEIISLDAPGDGSNDTWWGSGRVFVKPSTPEHPHLALNELVAARLATVLGLPVPMGDVGHYDGDRAAWVSAQIALQGQDVAPPDPASLATIFPVLTAGIVVFDVWLHNVDRHEENLLYHPSLGLWLIDHDQCLAGSQEDIATTLSGSRDHSTPSYAFVSDQVIQAHAGEWIERIQRHTDAAVSRTVQDARDRRLLTADQGAAVLTFLSYRRRNLGALVQRSMGWPSPVPQTNDSDAQEGETLWP
ncbi:hypothetical protein JD79_04073 [Geodermatophilus normandii]|uniref:Uncharacterized protein n=1 Tax=Geodermatophilus normandii TaxID=1137989 RepID=A0A317QNF7_9ACTN|nr:HipA domain-containing protein [Geodermatophilus normandii]PWW24882.1 hypothetical protein JD79_04073 [Geodermatophilus normandii]